MIQNLKLYYIIPGIALILLIVILLISTRKTPQNLPVPTNSPLPTRIQIEVTQQANPSPEKQPTQKATNPLTPTLIPPTFTGAFEDQHIPQAETDLAVQKTELRKKTPLIQPGFTITFDYANDQFIVSLNEPKDANTQQFKDWLQANYSNIPLDRFNIK